MAILLFSEGLFFLTKYCFWLAFSNDVLFFFLFFSEIFFFFFFAPKFYIQDLQKVVHQLVQLLVQLLLLKMFSFFFPSCQIPLSIYCFLILQDHFLATLSNTSCVLLLVRCLPSQRIKIFTHRVSPNSKPHFLTKGFLNLIFRSNFDSFLVSFSISLVPPILSLNSW